MGKADARAVKRVQIGVARLWKPKELELDYVVLPDAGSRIVRPGWPAQGSLRTLLY